MKTKRWYAEQILGNLTNDFPNIDVKLEEREVYLQIDAVVNELAKQNYFENWKFGGYGIDDQYITKFEVTVQDRTNGLHSFFVMPANYASLPRNGGIVEIYPQKWNTSNQPAVVVISHEDYRRYKSHAAGNLQGRLSGSPDGANFEFHTCEVAKKYGELFDVRLAIRDSSMIADNVPYPIPADKEGFVIATVVAWYRQRREVPTDTVRDNKDVA